MFGLCLHLLNQPGALHRFTETGIVFDIGRDRQLPARLQALHHDGVQTGARAIDGGGQPGRPRTNDEHAVLCVAMRFSLSNPVEIGMSCMESQHRMAIMAANIRYTAAKSGFCSRPRTDMTMHHRLALVPLCLGVALAAGPRVRRMWMPRPR
jgi:hypothetical protein